MLGDVVHGLNIFEGTQDVADQLIIGIVLLAAGFAARNSDKLGIAGNRVMEKPSRRNMISRGADTSGTVDARGLRHFFA